MPLPPPRGAVTRTSSLYRCMVCVVAVWGVLLLPFFCLCPHNDNLKRASSNTNTNININPYIQVYGLFAAMVEYIVQVAPEAEEGE